MPNADARESVPTLAELFFSQMRRKPEVIMADPGIVGLAYFIEIKHSFSCSVNIKMSADSKENRNVESSTVVASKV